MAWKSSFRQNYRTTLSPTVPTSAAGISHVVSYVEAPGGEKWEHLKNGGKQWQATHKNLHRMQRTRAIPVAWLSSGLCPDRPKGWIPIIMNHIKLVVSRYITEKEYYVPNTSCLGMYVGGCVGLNNAWCWKHHQDKHLLRCVGLHNAWCWKHYQD